MSSNTILTIYFSKVIDRGRLMAERIPMNDSSAPIPVAQSIRARRTCFEITAMTADAVGFSGMYSANAKARDLRDVFLRTEGSCLSLTYPQAQKSEIRDLIREQVQGQFSEFEVEQVAHIVDGIERVLGARRSGPRQEIPGVGSFEVIWMITIASYLSYLIGDYDDLS
jgi:hypothetical protein